MILPLTIGGGAGSAAKANEVNKDNMIQTPYVLRIQFTITVKSTNPFPMPSVDMLLANNINIVLCWRDYAYVIHTILQHADEQFDRIVASHPTSFTCKQGCHACCEPGLTVLKVEAENIANLFNNIQR